MNATIKELENKFKVLSKFGSNLSESKSPNKILYWILTTPSYLWPAVHGKVRGYGRHIKHGKK